MTVQRVEGNTAANTPPGQTAWRVTVPPDDPNTPLNEATNTFFLDGVQSNGTYLQDTGTAAYKTRYGCNNRQVQVHNLLKDFRLGLPPGLLTNPTAVTPCEAALFVIGACPPESVIGYSAATRHLHRWHQRRTDRHSYAADGRPAFCGAGPAGDLCPAGGAPGTPAHPDQSAHGRPRRATSASNSTVDSLPTALNGQFAKLLTIDTYLCARVPATRHLRPVRSGDRETVHRQPHLVQAGDDDHVRPPVALYRPILPALPATRRARTSR